MWTYFNKEGSNLARLEQKFKDQEQLSLAATEADVGKYLCFRLDGIKASKKFLKGSLSNKAFNNSFRFSIQAVYRMLKNCTGVEYKEYDEGNFFLCAICFSDEVSFILNNRRNHLENRLFKTGTTLAGTLSGAMSLHYKGESSKKAKPASNGVQYPQVMAFDARPLILDSRDEVEEYIRYRWLVSGRNTVSKVLRLAKVLTDDELYRTDIKDNLDVLCKFAEQRELQGQYHDAMREFTLFIPSELTHEGIFNEIRSHNGTDGIDVLCERLRNLPMRS